MRVEKIGRATLYLGRCEDVLPTLRGVAAVLDDPPYGMGYRSNHNSGRRGNGAKLARKDGDFAPIEGDNQAFDPGPILALGVPTILWGGNHFCERLPSGNRWLIWDKLAGKTPVPSGSDIDLAWTSEKGPSRMFTHLWRGIMRAGEENVVHSPKHHPNQKPVALMSWCLSFLPDGLTLDPHMGSGSTGVACLRMGRPFVGIECEERYFETACKRIEDAQRQGSLFESAA